MTVEVVAEIIARHVMDKVNNRQGLTEGAVIAIVQEALGAVESG